MVQVERSFFLSSRSWQQACKKEEEEGGKPCATGARGATGAT